MFRHFRILRNPNYAAYFTGQLISMSGTWMQNVAQSWLVYRLSGSGAWLGAVMFSNLGAAFVASPIAGVIADRFDRRRIIIFATLAQTVQCFVLAWLIYTGRVTLWQLVGFSAFLGVAGAFDITARHAFAVDIVGKEDLPSAIALNTVLFNTARVLGPSLAGPLIVIIGEAGCYFINALSDFAVVTGLLVMRLRPREGVASAGAGVVEHVREGWAYARGHAAIRRLLVYTAVFSMFGVPMFTLLPMVVKTHFNAGAHLLGWLTASYGIGAVAGTMSRANFDHGHDIGSRVRQRLALLGLALAGLALVRVEGLAMVAMFFAGSYTMGTYPMINNSIQQLVADSMRGRVLSLYTMTFFGMAPIASALCGAMADHFGVTTVLLAGGAFALVYAGVSDGAIFSRSRVAARLRSRSATD